MDATVIKREAKLETLLFVERSTARRVAPRCSETTTVEEPVELRMRLTSTEAQVKRGSEKNSGRWTFWLVRNRVADQYVCTAILFLTRCELFLEHNSSHVDSFNMQHGWEIHEPRSTSLRTREDSRDQARSSVQRNYTFSSFTRGQALSDNNCFFLTVFPLSCNLFKSLSTYV